MMMMCLLLRILQSVIETKHVDALVLVGDEDVATRIHDHVFGLADKTRSRQWPQPRLRIPRHEVRDLAWHALIANVVHPQPGVEVAQKHSVLVVHSAG